MRQKEKLRKKEKQEGKRTRGKKEGRKGRRGMEKAERKDGNEIRIGWKKKTEKSKTRMRKERRE